MTTPVSKPIQIQYYKTNVGNFFRINSGVTYYGSNALQGHGIVEINGVNVTTLQTHNGGWYLLDTELKDFKKKAPESHNQIGWKLKNPKIASEELPETLAVHQIERNYDEDDGYTGSHADYFALYEPMYEVTPAQIVPVEVDLTLIRELDVGNYSKPAEMKVQMREGSFVGKTQTVDLSHIASLSEIETLLTPEFMYHTRPCSLSSEQVYKIVREHIIQNINGAVARVDSNYEFCFSVVKKVQTKPYAVKKESYTRSGNSYKPPRFVCRTIDTKDVKIFEMTWKGYKGNEGYRGYTCIEGWEANNLQELYDNMQRYLTELMQVINEPVKECQHCNGVGFEYGTIGTNQR